MASSKFSYTIIITIFLTILILPTLVCGKPPRVSPPPPPPPPPSPIRYTLALQWGFTVCNQQPRCKSIKLRPDFTIHGYWLVGKEDLVGCSGDVFGDILLVKRLMKDLDMYWLDCEYGNNEIFLKHEYNVHGICDNGTVYAYFNKVLKIYNPRIVRLKLGKEVQNIFSSQTTVKEGVLYSGLKAVINKDFEMICRKDGNIYKLQELRLEFIETGNQATLVDIAQKPSTRRCPPNVDIMLPTM